MTSFTGRITEYIGLLGATKDAPAVLALVDSSAEFRESDAIVDPSTGATIVVIRSLPDGVSLNFTDGVLEKINLDVNAARPGALVDRETLLTGVDLISLSKQDVLDRWGEPSAKGKRALQYRDGQAVVTFTYLREDLIGVTVRLAGDGLQLGRGIRES